MAVRHGSQPIANPQPPILTIRPLTLAARSLARHTCRFLLLPLLIPLCYYPLPSLSLKCYTVCPCLPPLSFPLPLSSPFDNSTTLLFIHFRSFNLFQLLVSPLFFALCVCLYKQTNKQNKTTRDTEKAKKENETN